MELLFSRRPRLMLAAVAGAFFLIGLLIYGWGLHTPFVRWDDGMLIYENPAIRHISGATLKWIFTHYDPELYIPLTFFTYQLNFFFGGIDPFGYKLVNLLLHSANAFLVFLVASQLLRKRMWAVLCGLLFLVHPLHTEAVMWASARKDVLSTFFFLLSILSYFRWREMSTGAMASRPYIASLAYFLLGLLSKVMVLTLPLVLLLLDLWQGRKLSWAMLREKIPYFALSVLFGIIGLLGKTGVIEASTPLQKIVMAGKSMVFYLEKIVWPVNFSLLYPFTGDITLLSPAFAVPWAVLIVLVILALFCRKRMPAIMWSLLFFVVTVGPTLLNFSKGELDLYFASDRYAYVPSIGIFLIICALGDSANRPYIRRIALAGVASVLVILGILAHRQSRVWADTRSLFVNVIRIYPGASYVAHNNLGNMERLQGHLDAALAEYQQSLAVRRTPKTLSNIGATYRRLKRYDEALAMYAEALSLDPHSAPAHFGLGIVQAERGDYTAAEKSYEQALIEDPTYEEVYVNMGALRAAEGQYAEARDAYRKALSINPAIPEAQFNLGIALHELGDDAGAITAYGEALSLDPRMLAARINLGLLLYSAGDTDGAATQFRAVLQIDPTNKSAQSALTQMGLL